MKYSDIPNVNRLLTYSAVRDLNSDWAVELIRIFTAEIRTKIKAGQIQEDWSEDDWDQQLKRVVQENKRLRYQTVINATGIVVHTNLGRAPLNREVIEYMQSIGGYTDLELRLDTGKRGGRLEGIRRKLCQMTGAEDALVVNNNAAAVLLILSAIASGREVVVSRGELVEIGGSFRIPDVIQQGGAILKEVGCTNRLHLRDIESVLHENTGAILRVHTSNYRVVGFTSSPSRTEVCRLAQEHDVPVVEDLGSGLLREAPNVPWKEELEREESIFQALEQGVDVVCASGDKLLGGVQAGLILGRKKWIDKCRKHPLYRALRLDKMILAGLEATLQFHIEGRSHELPVWKYLERSSQECHLLAVKIAEGIDGLNVEPSHSLVGGGALPERKLDTWAITIRDVNVEEMSKTLRVGCPAIMGRVQHNAIWLDVRTVDETQVEALRMRLQQVLSTK